MCDMLMGLSDNEWKVSCEQIGIGGFSGIGPIIYSLIINYYFEFN